MFSVRFNILKTILIIEKILNFFKYHQMTLRITAI